MDQGSGADAVVMQEYTRMALVYEERVAPRFAPLAARTVADAAIGPGMRVLDVGCGTGLATLLAGERVGPQGEVVGVDFSEGQLGIAQGKAALRGLAQVRFERRDALASPYRGEFDAAISNLGMPLEADRALAGMRLALRDGGRVSIAAWEDGANPTFDAFRALVEQLRVETPPPELALARQAMASRKELRRRWGSPEAWRGALEGAGFREVRVARVAYEVPFQGWRALYDFLLAWGWTEQEVRALPGPDREALHAALAARWPSPFVDRWGLLHATGTA
jgi:ubiquinone/menaquinone biosynthesis C-methylase UbiE